MLGSDEATANHILVKENGLAMSLLERLQDGPQAGGRHTQRAGIRVCAHTRMHTRATSSALLNPSTAGRRDARDRELRGAGATP
jgi:hypothetical protein